MNRSSFHIVKSPAVGFAALMVALFTCSIRVGAEGHLTVALTQQGVQKIKENLGQLPILHQTLENARQEVEQALIT